MVIQFSESGKDVLKPPEARRFLFFTLNLLTTASGNNAEQVFEDMKPFFQFIFYTIDRMKRLRLSREVTKSNQYNHFLIINIFAF